MDDIPAEFWQGVEQFNQGEYYACHDTLEAIWMEAPQSEKNFYQGILQIAVALYHLSNQNWRGCVILMGEGLNRLRAYQPSYAELDIDTFFQQTAELHQYLQHLGPDQVSQAITQLNLSHSGTQSPNSESEISSAIQLPVLQKLP
jgi:uncharacterized protein